MTNEQKKKALFDYINRCRDDQEIQFSCQWKAGRGEKRFCRTTGQTSCKGCDFYQVGIWDFFGKCYDLLKRKDDEITRLAVQNEALRKGLTYPARED